MHTVLPPGALGFCTLGAPPMIRKGGLRAILLGTGRIPPRCACLEYTSTAGEVGTRTLQVTTADSASDHRIEENRFRTRGTNHSFHVYPTKTFYYNIHNNFFILEKYLIGS